MKKDTFKFIIFDECSNVGCAGFNYPNRCIHDGIYNPENKMCQECKKDAINALGESLIDKKSDR